MPAEPEGSWQVLQYGLPLLVLEAELAAMSAAVKPGWYIHAFNLAEGLLYVILPGRTFRLPAQKDDSWSEMIEYGASVGVERKWTERIPLRV